MPDYAKGCVYQIVCCDPNITDKYIGSTCNLIKRRASHKSISHNEKSNKYHLNVYKFIREHGGWDNFKVIEIEKTPCTTKTELSQHELRHFLAIKPTLNKNVMLRTDKQYRVEHTEKHKEYDKIYRAEHAEKIKAIKGEKIACECGVISRKDNLTRHKRSKKHQKFIFQSQPEHIQAQVDKV